MSLNKIDGNVTKTSNTPSNQSEKSNFKVRNITCVHKNSEPNVNYSEEYSIPTYLDEQREKKLDSELSCVKRSYRDELLKSHKKSEELLGDIPSDSLRSLYQSQT